MSASPGARRLSSLRGILAFAERNVLLGASESGSPATRNRTRDHLIAARLYSQMLCQLSYSRRCQPAETRDLRRWQNRVTKR